jgi:hypothetical protein
MEVVAKRNRVVQVLEERKNLFPWDSEVRRRDRLHLAESASRRRDS